MSPASGTLLLLLVAAGQSPVPATGEPRQDIVSITTGRQDTTVGDVTRSGIPIETSPVSLEGHGVFAAARYERRGSRSSHTFDGSWARASSFALSTPALQLPVPDDRARRLDVRYQYERVFWRNRWVRGLEMAAGPVAVAAWQAVERHPSPSNAVTITDLDVGGGGVVSVRLARWERVRIDAAWTTALALGRMSEDAEPSTAVRDAQAGGGWLWHGTAGASVRLAPRLWLRAGYGSLGQARFASHRGQSDRHARFELGVTHVR